MAAAGVAEPVVTVTTGHMAAAEDIGQVVVEVEAQVAGDRWQAVGRSAVVPELQGYTATAEALGHIAAAGVVVAP